MSSGIFVSYYLINLNVTDINKFLWTIFDNELGKLLATIKHSSKISGLRLIVNNLKILLAKSTSYKSFHCIGIIFTLTVGMRIIDAPALLCYNCRADNIRNYINYRL